MDTDQYRAYQLTPVKGGKFRTSDLQWALGQFEQQLGYVPTVYLRNPGTVLDQPFAAPFTDDERLRVGDVFLGPLRG